MGGIAAAVHYSTQAARGYDVCQGSREQEASSFPACVGSPGIAPGTATANGGLQPDIIRTSRQVWRQSKATARRPARPERGAAVQGHSSPLRCPSHIFRCQRPAAGSHLRVVSSGSPLYPHIAELAPCQRVCSISAPPDETHLIETVLRCRACSPGAPISATLAENIARPPRSLSPERS